MKILIIGSGGREHAILLKMRGDDPAADFFCAPGNAGTAGLAVNVPIKADDVAGLLAWAKENGPDLTVVGPEVPLCLGLADEFAAAGLRVFGPCRAAARMEGSKAFAKQIMSAAAVPTARYVTVSCEAAARAAVAEFGVPVVFKADGLAAGKGVIVCLSQEDVDAALAEMFGGRFGASASSVLVEEYLEGEEASILAFVDGTHVVPLASAQDHKRRFDGDKGPNTGGMGAYSPAPAVTDDMMAVIESHVLQPVVNELSARGIAYKGILYAGLMLTATGPRVIEFNCRFGDPETQPILARLASPLIEPMQACIDGTLDSCRIEWKPEHAACVVMVSGGYPGDYARGAVISGIDAASAVPNVRVIHAGTKRREDGATVADGGRVLCVTATGATLREAVDSAYRGVIKIRFDGAEYRADIAHLALNRRD